MTCETAAVDAPITGHCDPRFTAVSDAFAENFASRGEVGAGVCVIIDGVAVVDVVGGWVDETRTRTWQPDTIVNFYSVGKALIGLLALRAIDAGKVDLDGPVASLWPEFAAHGKERVTVREALCHRAAVPAIGPRLTNDDLAHWDTMASALAATRPWWEPGTRHAYHTNTYGHLIGEITRRATNELPGPALRALAEPLDSDVWYGVPRSEQHRCADIVWAPAQQGSKDGVDYEQFSGDQRMVMQSYFNPPGYASVGIVNTPEWRGFQVPSTNGHGTARGVARVYAALLQPGRLLSSSLLAEATSAQSVGYCPVLDDDVTFGLGFKPTVTRRPFGPNAHSFGHFGSGGAVGFADPDAGVAFAYVMNHVIPRWQSTRNRSLIDAVYDCI